MRARTVGSTWAVGRVLGCVALTTTIGACKARPSEDAPAKTEEHQREPAPPDDRPGALASESCTFAMAVLDRLDIYRGVEWPLDPSKVRATRTRIHDEAGVLDWLADTDRALGRVSEGEPTDLALINDVLARMPESGPIPEGDQETLRVDLTRIVTRLRAVTLLEMRRLLAEVADGRATEPKATWDQAYCLWDGGLRKLAARADELPARGGEAWELSIAEAFELGRAALDDPVEVKATKQKIEKGMYAVAYRLILTEAESQTAVGASEARELVDALEDRLADRNGPGLERIRAQLDGAPANIDATLIERELAVAFTKRARKYCDKAVISAELATPDAIAETWEGVIYTQVILPSMREALSAAGFDADAYSADWQAYLEAVTTGDTQTAAEISARLVEWNCAYQEQLGLTQCSSSTNEEK